MTKPARKDRPVYAFCRRGNALIPDMSFDLRALDGVANGQRVRIEIREWRNLDRLKAYWSLLHEAIEATGAAITPEKLHEVIKLETGHVELVRLPNGMTVAIPASIALDKMTEPEMVTFFQAAEAWLAATYGFVGETKCHAA